MNLNYNPCKIKSSSSSSLYRYTVYNGVTPGHVSVSANLMEAAFKQKLVGEQIGWLVQHTVALSFFGCCCFSTNSG